MKDKVLTKGFDYDDQLIHGDKIENRKYEGHQFDIRRDGIEQLRRYVAMCQNLGIDS